MERTVYSIAAIALAVLVMSSAGAEPVPEDATGNWSIENCDSGPRVLVTSNAALVFEGGDQKTAVAVARAEWAAGSVVLDIENEAEELILPPTDDLQRCPAPPIFFSMMFAESVSLFRRMDEIEAVCAGGKASMPCVALVFDLIDVSDDGMFSRAEISRATRAASFFVGYSIAVSELKNAFVPVEKLSVAWLSASLIGPAVAANVVSSYDYDGDDRLSLEELLQDRTPEEGIRGIATGLGVCRIRNSARVRDKDS